MSYIYLLKDPSTKEIRFVGACKGDVKLEVKRYLWTMVDKVGKPSAKDKWLASLGTTWPLIETIEECTEDQQDIRLAFHTKKLKREGHKLTVDTAWLVPYEGEIHHRKGKKHSAETLKKMSEVKMGEKHPMFGKENKWDETRKQRFKDSMAKNKSYERRGASQEWRDKIGNANKKYEKVLVIDAETGQIIREYAKQNDAKLDLGVRTFKGHDQASKPQGTFYKAIGKRCYVERILRIKPDLAEAGTDSGQDTQENLQ